MRMRVAASRCSCRLLFLLVFAFFCCYRVPRVCADEDGDDDDFLEALQFLHPDDLAAHDRFGFAVAMSKTHLAVSAPEQSVTVDDDTTYPQAGAVYVYEYDSDDGLWKWATKLTAETPVEAAEFGWDLAIDGGLLVVGTDHEQVHVFEYDPLADYWDFVALLEPPERGTGFGFSDVAVSENVIAVGAQFDGTANQGAVYVYERVQEETVDTDHVVTLQHKIVASDPIPAALFGSSLALHQDLLVVGAPGLLGADAESDFAGAAYVVRLYQDSFLEETQIELPPETDNRPTDGFGSMVAVRGTGNDLDSVICVSAMGKRDNRGAVYSFLGTEPYSLEGMLWADDSESNDAYGISLAMSADITLVGADIADGVDDVERAGAVYLYGNDLWVNQTQSMKLAATDGASYDYFGTSVAVVSDRAIAVGASGRNNFTGIVYVFQAPTITGPPHTADPSSDAPPPTDEPPADEASTEPPTSAPPDEEPPTEEPSAEEPSAEEPSTAEPSPPPPLPTVVAPPPPQATTRRSAGSMFWTFLLGTAAAGALGYGLVKWFRWLQVRGSYNAARQMELELHGRPLNHMII